MDEKVKEIIGECLHENYTSFSWKTEYGSPRMTYRCKRCKKEIFPEFDRDDLIKKVKKLLSHISTLEARIKELENIAKALLDSPAEIRLRKIEMEWLDSQDRVKELQEGIRKHREIMNRGYAGEINVTDEELYKLVRK